MHALDAEAEPEEEAQPDKQEKMVEDTIAPVEDDTLKDSTPPPNPTDPAKATFTVPNRVDLSLDESKALFKVRAYSTAK